MWHSAIRIHNLKIVRFLIGDFVLWLKLRLTENVLRKYFSRWYKLAEFYTTTQGLAIHQKCHLWNTYMILSHKQSYSQNRAILTILFGISRFRHTQRSQIVAGWGSFRMGWVVGARDESLIRRRPLFSRIEPVCWWGPCFGCNTGWYCPYIIAEVLEIF